MPEIVNMTDIPISSDAVKWADGEYPPGSMNQLKRTVVTLHTNPKSCYCFGDKPIVDYSTLEEFANAVAVNGDLYTALQLHEPTTEVVIQTRQWIPGLWYDVCNRVEKNGRHSPWETTKILKERTNARP